MIRLALFAALAVPVVACTAASSTGITAADLECPVGSTLSYATFGAAFMTDNCLSCHTTKQRPALTTLAAVQANKAAIISFAVTTARMPADGSISDEERQVLGEWLTCGAP